MIRVYSIRDCCLLICVDSENFSDFSFLLSGFQMSVASDSPVHSSSSDDLAGFLEAELDSDSDSSSESFPIEEAEDDAEDTNHR